MPRISTFKTRIQGSGFRIRAGSKQESQSILGAINLVNLALCCSTWKSINFPCSANLRLLVSPAPTGYIRHTATRFLKTTTDKKHYFIGTHYNLLSMSLTHFHKFDKVAAGHSPMAGSFEYIRGQPISKGPFGTDYLGLNKTTAELFAIREVENPAGTKLEDLASSLDILMAKGLRHNNLITYLGYEFRDATLLLRSEYIIGNSNIASYIQKHGNFEDSIIRSLARQIILGLEYLQTEGVPVNNLNSSNIFLDMKGTTKIASFGIPAVINCSQDNPVFEVLGVTGKSNENQSNKADIWLLGATVLEMFRGYPPSKVEIEALSQPSANSVDILKGKLPEISPNGLDFIGSCFTV